MSTPAPRSRASDPPRIPLHIAVIMDGNGRWAERRHLPRSAGHHAGVESARRIVEACGNRGVKVLTLFAFSSENWHRPAAEVRVLMDLFLATLQREGRRLHRNAVRLRLIGDHSRFPPALQERITELEQITADNDGLQLVIAANYGGRWDLTQAARALCRRTAEGRLDPAAVTSEDLNQHLATATLPEPDLFIRTGGERRVSNFLLWQLAYTELYFTDTLWPDFDEADLELALADYARRQRRFGRVGEQVEPPAWPPAGGATPRDVESHAECESEQESPQEF